MDLVLQYKNCETPAFEYYEKLGQKQTRLPEGTLSFKRKNSEARPGNKKKKLKDQKKKKKKGQKERKKEIAPKMQRRKREGKKKIIKLSRYIHTD